MELAINYTNSCDNSPNASNPFNAEESSNLIAQLGVTK